MAALTTITWNAEPGNTTYVVEYKKSDSSTWLPVPGSPTSSTSIQVSVDEGTEYDYRVIAYCGTEPSGPLTSTQVSLCKPPVSLNAAPNIDYVTLTWGTQPEHVSYVVEYKKEVDATWLTATGSPVTNPYPANGSLVVGSLDTGTAYDFRVRTNCVENTSVFIEIGSTTVTPIWVENTYTCEQDTPFSLADTYTGFSSPQGIYFDETLQRFYVVDLDDVSGNLWYFDPATFAGTGDRNYVSGTAVSGGFVQSYDFSPSLRKIFMCGPSTSGVVVHNIAANTTNTITQGSNGSFSRLFTKILNGVLYVGNQLDGTIALIDPVADTVNSTVTIAGIPANTGNKYFNNSYQIYAVNSELWVCAGSYRSTNGSIARYNSDFSVFIGELTVPGVTSISGGGWSNGFWQSQFYDQEKNRFYLTDVGSKTTTVIDTNTNTIITQVPVTNLEGKSYAFVAYILNPLNGQLYANKLAINDPSDGSPINKFYIVNRDVYRFEALYLGSTTAGLQFRLGTNEFWACSPGLPGWAEGPPPGWDTDGEVYKYNS